MGDEIADLVQADPDVDEVPIAGPVQALGKFQGLGHRLVHKGTVQRRPLLQPLDGVLPDI